MNVYCLVVVGATTVTRLERFPIRTPMVIRQLFNSTLTTGIPRPQPLAVAEFTTLRMRLIKIAARVVETASRVRIAFAMVPRRAMAAGIKAPRQPQVSRNRHHNGGTREHVQSMAAHENTRTTKLYDRTQDRLRHHLRTERRSSVRRVSLRQYGGCGRARRATLGRTLMKIKCLLKEALYRIYCLVLLS